MYCGFINLARYVYFCDSQREERFGVGASAKSAGLLAVCTSPRGARADPGAAGPENLISRKGLQTEKIPNPPCTLKMFQRQRLHFVFDLNLSPGPTSQLGGSDRCPASETGDFCLSAKLLVLL